MICFVLVNAYLDLQDIDQRVSHKRRMMCAVIQCSFTQYRHNITRVLLYILLLQGCRSQLHMVPGEDANVARAVDPGSLQSTGGSPAIVSPVAPGYAMASGASSDDQEDGKPAAKHQKSERSALPFPTAASATNRPYDVFISHAGEDKEDIAIPLYQELSRADRGILPFLDEEDLRVGDAIEPKILEAMDQSLVGIFLLSPDFIAKKWPMKELDYFLARKHQASSVNGYQPTLIPVFYRLSVDDCSCDYKTLKTTWKKHFSQHGFEERTACSPANYVTVLKSLGQLEKTLGITSTSKSCEQLIREITDKLQRILPELRATYRRKTNVHRTLLVDYYRASPYFTRAPSLLEGRPQCIEVLDYPLLQLNALSSTEASDGLPGEVSSQSSPPRSHGKEVQTIEPKDLFKGSSSHSTRSSCPINKVLVIGNPGTGKTTFSKQLAYGWTSGKWGEEFSVVYVLPVRHLKKGKYGVQSALSSAIVDLCFGSLPYAGLSYDSLLRQVSESLTKSSTLVILDGLDERAGACESLIGQVESGKHKLLMLSRSYNVALERGIADIEVSLIGLGTDQQRRFIKTHLPLDQVDSLLTQLAQHRQIREIAQLPVNLSILCHLWGGQASRARVLKAVRQGSLSSLYREVTRYIWERYASSKLKELPEYKEKATDVGLPVSNCEILFDTLGKIGLSALQSGDEVIEDTLVSDYVPGSLFNALEVLQDSGFLLLKWLAGSGQYEFPHLTFQEYFAGRWLAKELWSADASVRSAAETFFKSGKYTPRYGLLCSFLSGEVSKDRGEAGLRALLNLSRSGEVETDSLDHVGLQCRLLNEWLSISKADEVQEKLPGLERDYHILSGFWAQWEQGIDLLEQYRGNNLCPLLVQLLIDFSALAPHAAPRCLSLLLAVCDEGKNSHAANICFDTALQVSQLSPLQCFPVLSATISDEGMPPPIRCAALSAVGSLIHVDTSPHVAIRSILASASTDATLAASELARSSLRSLDPRPDAPKVDFVPFDKSWWKRCFGVEVEDLPLPTGVEERLAMPCPFCPGRKVRDTHLLVLIPATVNGEAFTLNKLGDLAKRHFRANAQGYRYYDKTVAEAYGSAPVPSSYWLLMTREILLGSRGMSFDALRALVSSHALRTGLRYRIPGVLEVATAVLTHYVRTEERLLADDPYTYTLCSGEMFRADLWLSPVVGGFGASGLRVFNYRLAALSPNGVAGCWKF